MFVKKVKDMTMLPNQRIHPNSRNRIRKLIKKRSSRGREDRVLSVAFTAPELS